MLPEKTPIFFKETAVDHNFTLSERFKFWQKIKQMLKQYPEAELLLFKTYLHSSSVLSSNNNRAYSKK